MITTEHKQRSINTGVTQINCPLEFDFSVLFSTPVTEKYTPFLMYCSYTFIQFRFIDIYVNISPCITLLTLR